MKEDILEQLASDYLEALGYFTLTNIKFRPDPSDPDFDSKQDSVHSDIDVLGYCPKRAGVDKVIAVSCKSLQEGFWPEWEVNAIEKNKIVSGREAWRRYRELVVPKWARAFRKCISDLTNESTFVYVTAVTKVNDDRSPWENNSKFRETLGAEIKLLSLNEMVEAVLPALSNTVANSELGRTLQLFKAAGILGDNDA
ncbi:hypothetical protein [Cyanobium sp. Morenito 9A2]|uniref:hypothetical protein n=1 Tax=Cyanobium sp. Morenito 9A2 TaxID=2823718 RepID=UPI0020CE0A9A|nr:hypothetical protein [Cyanobium sp. Morenito 9A2]MCP9848869.1 hypothetical protein [Cyanobium sp. Morenito 9A2]